MKYGRRRYRPARGRRFRRRSYARRTRRGYRRRFRRSRTISAPVRLTLDATWAINSAGNPPKWSAFSFSPLSLPGFSDYQTTYSHFRILKAKLYISRDTGSDSAGASWSTCNYLVVGSRPFAATTVLTQGFTTADKLVPPQTEDALRQTKWQRVHYPSTTTQRVTASFYPYTLVITNGPYTTGNYQFQRIWEGRKWMPFTWATTGSAVSFFGPYLVVDTSAGELPTTPLTSVQCTLQLAVQFKGQR